MIGTIFPMGYIGYQYCYFYKKGLVLRHECGIAETRYTEK